MRTTPPVTTQQAEQPELTWSLSEVAKRTGVSVGMIGQAVKEGFIAVSAKRQYQAAPTLLGLLKFLGKRLGTLPSYDNMKQCSAATGFPVSIIKRIRRTSREAFQDTRISLGPLLKEKIGALWVDKLQAPQRAVAAYQEILQLIPNHPKTVRVLRDLFAQAGDYQALETKCKALLAQIELEKAQGLKLDKGEVGIAIRRAMGALWFGYERMAELELPSLLVGCGEETIRRHLVEAGNRLKATLSDELAKYAAGGKGEKTPEAPKLTP